MILRNMKILNGHEDMEPIPGKAIVIEDGKIKGIIDDNGEGIDLQGAYLLPGLINLHVHIPASGMPTKRKLDYEKLGKLLNLGIARSVIKKMCEKYIKAELNSGTTTIRAVGGVLDFDSQLRDKFADSGPRILAANTAISVPGGHMVGSVARAAHSAEEAVRMADELDKQHPDLIKLMITGGVLDADVPGSPGVLKMPPEYVKAACDRAHELGYPVAAHVEGTEGMIVALENGVDTIEHGGKPNKHVIKLFCETGSALVATLSPVMPFSQLDPKLMNLSDIDQLNGSALHLHMQRCIIECLKNGITVGLGTDTGCPYTTHYDFWRELYYFVQYCGVTNKFALHTATEVNAKIAHIDDETGTVDIGKSADFMVVSSNPLEDLTVLRKPTDVIFKGEIIHDPKIRKISAVERELDRLL